MSSVTTSPHAAVIGSGFGGLAAAVLMQNADIQTTIFEKRDRPGGRAYVYEDQGFIFDGGPTVITAPMIFEELFAETGRNLSDYVEMVPVDPFYRLIWEDGDTLNYNGDSESMISQIRERNPSDVDGYVRFTDYARRVFLAGYKELASTPFLRFSDMIRVAPALIKLRADRSVYQTVSRFVKNDHVRQALSFHSLLVGGNPYDTSSIYTLIHYLEREWGVFFPKGGTGALVRAIVQLFEELGGKIRLTTPVAKIDVDHSNGRAKHLVTTKAVEREPFDLVVSNADVYHTYASLLDGVSDAAPMKRRLEKMDWSMSLFVLYFGTNRRYDEHVAHHTILFGPRYKGLLNDLFYGDKLPEDFSLYLHAPTVTDPSLGPPGCETFYVLSPVPHLGNAPLDWDAIGESYADRILEYLESHLPDLRKHLVTKLWFTPQNFKDVYNTYMGSAFSCAPKLIQSAWFRPHNRDDRIPGLYIVGAGTHPGAGVPGVMNSAKATFKLVKEDFLS
jgi:phytoene desaturase